MLNTDRQRGCFQTRSRLNYFARNPFNSDSREIRKVFGNRGDWAKCLPTPSFAVLCVHDKHHGYNPSPLENQESEDVGSKKWR